MAERKKKVVRAADPSAAENTGAAGPAWIPTPEAKGQSTRFHWIAAVLWALAIAAEAVAVFWLLRQVPFTTGHLIGLIGAFVLIGALALIGAQLWKRANRLDPASRSDKVRFWVQNQLGFIIAIIAFLPLVILVFTNRNMDGRQKAIAGSIGVVIAVVVSVFAVDWSPVSQDQYADETDIIEQLTGEDLVYWTTSGSVFHVCEAVPDVNRESADMTIHEGTVAAAHAAGKDRLTKRWESEAINYCGYTEEQVDAVHAAIRSPGDDDSGSPEEEESPADEVSDTRAE